MATTTASHITQRNQLAAVVLAIALCVTRVGAQVERSTPSLTRPQDVPRGELVFPQSRGELQITVTSAVAGGERQLMLPLSVEYGITGAWQLNGELESSARIGRRSEAGGESSGITGGSVGVQRSWLGLIGPRTHLALGTEVEMDRGTDRREVAFVPNVALGRDVGRPGRTHLFAHGAARFTGGDVLPSTSAGIIVPVRAAMLVAEWTRAMNDTASEDGHSATTELTPGLIVTLGEFELVAGAPVRIRPDSPRVGAILKLTREF